MALSVDHGILPLHSVFSLRLSFCTSGTWKYDAPMLSGVVEFFVRVGVALLLPKFIGQNGIFYAEIAAWTGATILLVVSYYISIRKFKSAN